MGFDLVIHGATVVTPGHREAADIGIAGGRIDQLGGTMTGAEELAADGLLAVPGGVDAHTHLALAFRLRTIFSYPPQNARCPALRLGRSSAAL